MNTEKIKTIFNSVYVKAILLLLLLYILLPSYLPAASYLCELDKININTCLDASWVLSLHWAIQKHLIFGKDYLFTYGPLGFISTRTALGFSYLYLLFSDFFIIGNFVFILIYIFRRFYSFQTIGLCFLTTYCISWSGMYSDQIAFTYLLILIFWLNYFVSYDRSAALIIPAIVTALLFYIKVNIGFVGVIVFYIYLLYSLVSSKSKILIKVLFGLAVPVIIGLLSFPLRTDLPGYIFGSLSIVDGYNDAMNVGAGIFLRYIIYACVFIAIFFIAFFYKNIRANIPLLVTGGIFTFVLFKQSFVRSDLHIAIFFTFFPALCGLIGIYCKRLGILQLVILAVICASCLHIGLGLQIYPKLGDRLNYFTAVFYPNNIQERYENNFNLFDLPPEVKEKIGSGSVDVIPWNVDYLYFNRLNYNPRPIIQSYTAYTPYLLNFNRQKYESDSAPDFVFFSNMSIDGRYAFFDDQAVKIDLIKNYSCLGIYKAQDAEFLLFQKNSGRASFELSPPVEDTVNFDEEYNLKDLNKVYFIKIDVNYSLLGKLVRFAYKPFPVLINFTLADGSVRSARIIVPILKNGVLINPLIEDERDFYAFQNDGTIPDGKKIKSFKIQLDPPGDTVARLAQRTYDKTIKLSVSEVSIKKN